MFRPNGIWKFLYSWVTPKYSENKTSSLFIKKIELVPGLEVSFKIGGLKWPIEQKMVGHGPKHIDIWVVYFTYTLTQTLVCIYVYWLLILQ